MKFIAVQHSQLKINFLLGYMNTRRQLLTIIVLIFVFAWAKSTTIQCQSSATSWEPGKNLRLSLRETLVSTKYDQVDVIIDDQDGSVSRYIKLGGAWQPMKLRTMARFVKTGDTILNLGSHIGLESVVMGKIIGSKGKLFIFQPYSVSYNMVLKNIYLNQLGDIATVYNVGASNQYSSGYINVNLANTGGSEIFTNQSIARAPSKVQLVQVDLVDDVLPEDAVIDFALVDVERMQVEALEGMKETILKSPNIVIMCEWSGYSFNSKDIDRSKRSLLEWFKSHGFKFYHIVAGQPGICPIQKFEELSLDYVARIRGGYDLIDIFFVPGHIDPSKVV